MNKTVTGQKINLVVSIISLILIGAAIILNIFRYELFGVVPGNAPNNFSFNLTVFLPLSFFGLLLSSIALIMVFLKWRKWGNKKIRIFTIFFALPAMWLLILLVINTILILRVH
jgi:hypothetical protein